MLSIFKLYYHLLSVTQENIFYPEMFNCGSFLELSTAKYNQFMFPLGIKKYRENCAIMTSRSTQYVMSAFIIIPSHPLTLK